MIAHIGKAEASHKDEQAGEGIDSTKSVYVVDGHKAQWARDVAYSPTEMTYLSASR